MAPKFGTKVVDYINNEFVKQWFNYTDLKKRLDRASVVQKMKPAEMRGGHIGRSQFAARRCKAL